MMPEFNLVDESWIPCLLPDSRPVTLSLRETLTQAHTIREVYDPSPLVTVAIHRLLLAILHRNFGPATHGDWKRLWAARRWDSTVIGLYLDRWRSRFDLFHPERPFYQVPKMPGVATHPIQLLAQEAASGNNPTLFDHSYSDRPSPMPAASAARYLIATQAFAIGGGVSKPFNLTDAPLARGYTVLAIGDNLFETLALNLMEPPGGVRHTTEDLPAWEQDTPTQPDKAGTPEKGYLDYLTWQSRSIHLFPSEDGRSVAFCQLQQNLKPSASVLDPFKPYRRDKDAGFIPRRLDPARAVWRDSYALLELGGDDGRRPEVFNWLAQIEEHRRLGLLAANPVFRFAILGLATEPGKATAVAWVHERLTLPLAYLADESLIEYVREALVSAEKVGEILRFTALLLARRLTGREKDPAALQIASHLGLDEAYWARLDAPFRQFLLDLPGSEEAGLEFWRQTLRQTAVDVFRQALANLNASARELRAVAAVEPYFFGRLAAAVPGKSVPRKSVPGEEEEKA